MLNILPLSDRTKVQEYLSPFRLSQCLFSRLTNSLREIQICSSKPEQTGLFIKYDNFLCWCQVKERCRKEWTMFQNRLASAERTYFRTAGLDPPNSNGHQKLITTTLIRFDINLYNLSLYDSYLLVNHSYLNLQNLNTF